MVVGEGAWSNGKAASLGRSLTNKIRDVTIEGTMNALCVPAKDLAQLRGTVSEKKKNRAGHKYRNKCSLDACQMD